MKLVSLRVQNYKKIDDTGVVGVGDLTVFVGKNEAGKSAILRGLSKLNPSDGEQYDGLKEFPRRRFTDEFAKQDWPVATGRFRLSDAERQALGKVCHELASTEYVTCTRHYTWKLVICYDPPADIEAVARVTMVEKLDAILTSLEARTAPEGKGEAWGPIKQAVLQALKPLHDHHAKRPVAEVVPVAEVSQAVQVITKHMNEDWQKPLLDAYLSELKALERRAAFQARLDAADKWVAENLPKFIYFDRYDVLDSAVHIPSFRSSLPAAKAQQMTPEQRRARTTSCLFKHVNLDVDTIAALGAHNRNQGEDKNVRRQVDERAIRVSSAASSMTEKFSRWWQQRHHKFRYDVDGDYFRVWVSDDLDESGIELDQRSAGMQYFFSFYLVFLVERAAAHHGCILLLDEPGNNLHGTAQREIVKFLESVSAENQTLYTTHQPFMVDPDHLERARAVFEDPTTGYTKVGGDMWPKDKDCLFPLQAALGYQIAQSLFVGKRQIIIEGITDFWLIKALDIVLKDRGEAGLRNDIVLLPGGGATNVTPLASMLVGHGVEVVALFDGDTTGKREGQKLKTALFENSPNKVLFLNDFLPGGSTDIENLLPDDWVVEAAKAGYPQVNFSFTADERKMPNILDRLKSVFKRNGIDKIEKWRVVGALRDRLLESPKAVPELTLTAARSLFAVMNGSFSAVAAQAAAAS